MRRSRHHSRPDGITQIRRAFAGKDGIAEAVDHGRQLDAAVPVHDAVGHTRVILRGRCRSAPQIIPADIVDVIGASENCQSVVIDVFDVDCIRRIRRRRAEITCQRHLH